MSGVWSYRLERQLTKQPSKLWRRLWFLRSRQHCASRSPPENQIESICRLSFSAPRRCPGAPSGLGVNDGDLTGVMADQHAV
jgi:hypothetical protein